MPRKHGRTGLVAAVVAVAALAAVGGALAYFTGGGSGETQAAAVGTSSNFGVTFGTPRGAMFPGTGTDAIPFTITNSSSGAQALTEVTATVDNDGEGAVTSGGVGVPGCLAAWFTATASGPAAPVDLSANGQAGDSYAGTVTVTMSDSGTDQDPCEGQTPDVTVRAN